MLILALRADGAARLPCLRCVHPIRAQIASSAAIRSSIAPRSAHGGVGRSRCAARSRAAGDAGLDGLQLAHRRVRSGRTALGRRAAEWAVRPRLAANRGGACPRTAEACTQRTLARDTRIMVVWGMCDMRGGPFDMFASASPIPAGHGPWHCGPAWCSGLLPPMMPAEQGNGNSASTVLEGRINGSLVCAPPPTSSQWPGGAGCKAVQK
eukprot:3440235-Prymnesium_polylepis.1